MWQPAVCFQVDQLFRAQLFHDRKQYEERRRMSADERAKTPVVAPWLYVKIESRAGFDTVAEHYLQTYRACQYRLLQIPFAGCEAM